MRKEFSGIIVECIQGDIASQSDVEAVVNAANAQLMPGGGVAGAIHRKAGPGLAEECRPLAPIKTGEAVITGAHNLPNKYVIHTLGPVYGKDKPEDKLLASCYRKSLEIADQQGIISIAFPAISTGIFGYPAEEAAEVAFQTIKEKTPELNNIKTIRFVLYGKRDLEVHQKKLEEIFG
ncbi:MAG: O-acetyl-ADP-ribose deacetylase [Spirochaetes bacterium]|nr:MAG: O-acetyl-ADP-ribose deacetylase [Spirochaetota bacterium]